MSKTWTWWWGLGVVLVLSGCGIRIPSTCWSCLTGDPTKATWAQCVEAKCVQPTPTPVVTPTATPVPTVTPTPTPFASSTPAIPETPTPSPSAGPTSGPTSAPTANPQTNPTPTSCPCAERYSFFAFPYDPGKYCQDFSATLKFNGNKPCDDTHKQNCGGRVCDAQEPPEWTAPGADAVTPAGTGADGYNAQVCGHGHGTITIFLHTPKPPLYDVEGGVLTTCSPGGAVGIDPDGNVGLKVAFPATASADKPKAQRKWWHLWLW